MANLSKKDEILWNRLACSFECGKCNGFPEYDKDDYGRCSLCNN